MDQPTESPTTDASTILQLESLIVSHSQHLERVGKELSQTREMLASILENDSTYKLHDQNAKEAAKIRSATKSQLLKSPQAQKLTSTQKELRQQALEHKESLSSYLQDYARLTGNNEIEIDGKTRQIVYTAKLVSA